VEPLLSDVLDAKLSEFGSEADKYKKKSVDMKRLTGLDKKVKAGEALKKEDLAFLYEIDGKIEGFGYGSDPRIKEIKQGRNLKEDLAIIFDCSPESIIEDLKLIDEQTRLYVKKHTSRSLEGEKESLIIFDLLDERNALSYIMIKKFLDIEKELKAGKTPDRDDLDYMWGGQLDDDDI
jgi:DNA-binding cell septation regulator SpoVG